MELWKREKVDVGMRLLSRQRSGRRSSTCKAGVGTQRTRIFALPGRDAPVSRTSSPPCARRGRIVIKRNIHSTVLETRDTCAGCANCKIYLWSIRHFVDDLRAIIGVKPKHLSLRSPGTSDCAHEKVCGARAVEHTHKVVPSTVHHLVPFRALEAFYILSWSSHTAL